MWRAVDGMRVRQYKRNGRHSRLAARQELETVQQLARFIPLAADTGQAERLFAYTVRERQRAWQQAGEAEHFYVSDRARARVDAEIIDTIENKHREETQA